MPETHCNPDFDKIADLYDHLIDWPRRLSREGPFYQNFFALHGVRRVLDVGCGTGHHAAMFYSWGLDVEGADISPAMLERCRRLHGEDMHLRWVERSLTTPADPSDHFDAVVCLGNTLSLLNSTRGISHAARAMLASVRPGGVGIIQMLNLASIKPGPTVWQKVHRDDSGGLPTVLLKGVHREGQQGYIDIVQLKLPVMGVEYQVHSASFLGITRGELCAAMGESGGEILDVLGSYERDPFEETHSTDLIVCWKRRAEARP